MRRKVKRVPQRARKVEKKSMKNTQRGGSEDRRYKRGEAETRRESNEETDREGCRVK